MRNQYLEKRGWVWRDNGWWDGSGVWPDICTEEEAVNIQVHRDENRYFQEE